MSKKTSGEGKAGVTGSQGERMREGRRGTKSRLKAVTIERKKQRERERQNVMRRRWRKNERKAVRREETETEGNCEVIKKGLREKERDGVSAISNNCEWGFDFLIDCFVCERERCRVLRTNNKNTVKPIGVTVNARYYCNEFLFIGDTYCVLWRRD